jgi:hypothetical protein
MVSAERNRAIDVKNALERQLRACFVAGSFTECRSLLAGQTLEHGDDYAFESRGDNRSASLRLDRGPDLESLAAAVRER